MTLLDRRELTEHIRTVETFELPDVQRHGNEGEAATADRTTCEARLASYAEGVQKLLHDITALFTKTSSEHFEYLCSRRISYFSDSVDGALALVLALAVNAEVVDIQPNELDPFFITPNVLALTRRDLYINRPLSSPSRLSKLCITGGPSMSAIDMLVPPSVRLLRLLCCRIGNLIYNGSSSSQLEVLELEWSKIQAVELSNFLTESRCENLRELLLDNMRDIGGFGFTPHRLIETLELIAPKLEVLKIMDVMATSEWLAPIGNLKNLRKLHTLALSIDRLIFADGAQDTQPIDPFTILPPRLRNLELIMMSNSRLNKYFEDPDANALIPSGSQFIVDTLKNFPLRTLLLETLVGGTPQQLPANASEGTLTGLQALADLVFSKGIVLEACVHNFNGFKKSAYRIIPATCPIGDAPSTGV
tara:strand:+ start:60 stop:1316 length:1257 start_codon:yes stop_codon:yes gene_type:complete